MKRVNRFFVKCLAGGGALMLGGGCTAFHPADLPDLASDLPTAYAPETAGFVSGGRWWETLDDSALNRYMDRVLEENPSVLETWARLRQVQAEAAKAGAARWPSLDLVAGASVTERSQGAPGDASGPGGSGTPAEYYSLGLASSYEVDLWGRVRASDRAAGLAAEASEYDRQTAVLSLAASAVEAWFNLMAQREQVALLNDQLKANQTSLELIELRFDRSLATALDVFQQRQAVARVEAQIPLAKAREALFENQLAVLRGVPPGTKFGGPPSGATLPSPGPVPPVGLPADLLLQRPDVRAGWMRLSAAGWGLSAASADRLPALRITARGEYGADAPDDLFDNWLLNLAGNLAAPVVDGGRRQAEVDRAEAVRDERMAAYRNVVLNAFRDVEDALARERYQVEHLDGLGRQLDAARSAYQEAIERYRNGLTDYLPALTALATTQNLENSLIEQRRQHLLIRVALYRALGGTWMEEMKPPADPTPRVANRSGS